MSYDVVCAGVIYLDLTFSGLPRLPRQGEEQWARELALTPGGMANTAVALARLGLRTAVVGAIGEDLAGSYLRTMLESEGVACRGPRTDRSAVTAVLPVDGDRALVSHLPHDVATAERVPDLGAKAMVVPVDQVVHAPRSTQVYVVTSHADVSAADSGASIALRDSHAVLANEAEAIALTGAADAEQAALVLSQRARTAVVTLGPLGALAATQGEVVRAAAPPAEVRDATGAGDLFVAAYIWGDLAGLELPARLQWAALYATSSLSKLTAFAGAGTLSQLIEAGKQLHLPPP